MGADAAAGLSGKRGARGALSALATRHAAGPPTKPPGLVRCAGASAWRKLQSPFQHFRRTTMGKYLLAWLLGVPGIVLLLVYLFFH